MTHDAPPRHRILIVDDDESTRLLLARLVSTDLEAEVQLAGTCEQALRLVENYAYDAILLDLLMPGRGGLAVLKEVRAGSPNAATPVVIVSVVSEERSMQECMAAGATAYHLKPVRREALVAAVRAALASRRSRPSA
ncbi:MAG TPA: response regulator [Burkholderiales bacterium]|nr:response regulator [Burkholderiales bacterium]